MKYEDLALVAVLGSLGLLAPIRAALVVTVIVLSIEIVTARRELRVKA